MSNYKLLELTTAIYIEINLYIFILLRVIYPQNIVKLKNKYDAVDPYVIDWA